MDGAAVLRNRLLISLGERRPIVGFSHVVQDVSVTETLRSVDLDFLLIDTQHIVVTLETLQNTLIALQPADVAVLVRPVWNDQALIGQILDAGADGVIVPMVNTEADARRAVAATKYPPVGTRSWGPRRAARLHGGADVYAREADDNLAVFVQIETAEAVRNVDSILAVPGLTGVMVGPGDLAISLGYMHDRSNAAVIGTIQDVLDRCLERGVPFGFFAASVEQAQYWLERGALIMSCSSDTAFIAQGVGALAAAFAGARKGTASIDA